MAHHQADDGVSRQDGHECNSTQRQPDPEHHRQCKQQSGFGDSAAQRQEHRKQSQRTWNQTCHESDRDAFTGDMPVTA